MRTFDLEVIRAGQETTVTVWGVSPSSVKVDEARSGQPVVEEAEVYGPVGLDLLQGDVVSWNGTAWRVEGEVQLHERPGGRRAGAVATIRRSTPAARSTTPRRS